MGGSVGYGPRGRDCVRRSSWPVTSSARVAPARRARARRAVPRPRRRALRPAQRGHGPGRHLRGSRLSGARRHGGRPPARPPRRRRRLHGHVPARRRPGRPAPRRRCRDPRGLRGVELPDILDVHLHPRDVGGAIVALDAPVPPGSWRWGGPAWEGRVPDHGPGRSPARRSPPPTRTRMAGRWAHVLGAPLQDGATLVLDDGGELRFGAPAGVPRASWP